MLIQYAEKEWKKEKHIGETPVQIISEVKEHGNSAVKAIEAASKSVTKNKAEFERIKNDMYCYQAMADHFAEKAEAALHVLRYKYSNDSKDLEKALPLLEKSIDSYKELVRLTQGTYLYANSMQTQQRKIPIRGSNGTFKTWAEVLVPFENELNHFRYAIDSIKKNPEKTATQKISLPGANVNVTGTYKYYTIDSLSVAFSDTSFSVMKFVQEVKGLKGVQLSFQQQLKEGTELNFTNTQACKSVGGLF